MGIQAIGSGGAAVSGAGTPASQPANLDAELAKYQGQLADWTFCPSGKTPEGKAKIQQISERIGTIKTQMHKAQQARAAAKAPAAAQSQEGAPARVASDSKALGHRVDVYV